jgi:hypothetical protein
MRKIGIYLHVGNEYVGPFRTRGDAERFLILMKLHGESCEEIEITNLKIEAPPRSGKALIFRSGK